jgi:hypothetical protein
VIRSRSRGALRAQRARGQKGVVPQEDIASAPLPSEPEGVLPYADMKLPHEQDESSKDDPLSPRKVIQRAEQDLAEGMEDTDLYGRTGIVFDEKNRRGGS